MYAPPSHKGNKINLESKINQKAIIYAFIVYSSIFYLYLILFSEPKGIEIRVISFTLLLFLFAETLFVLNPQCETFLEVNIPGLIKFTTAYI